MADNFNDNQLDLISSGTTNYVFNEDVGDYIQVIVSNQDGDVVTLNDGSLAVFSSYNDDFTVYEDGISNVFVKPNEILSQFNVPSGNYRLRFNFLRNLFNHLGEDGDLIFSEFDANSDNPSTDPRYYINQISPSRKEIRLLGRKTLVSNNDVLQLGTSFQDNFKSILGISGDTVNPYNYNFVVRLDNGLTLPITNYVFDNSSIILRLQTPLPTDFNTLDIVSIEKILIDSQEQDIYYVSSVVGERGTAGLDVDTEENISGFTLSSDNVEDNIYPIGDIQSNLNNGADIQETIYGYDGNQMLLHSDRITLNSKLDDIFLSSI